MVSIGSFLPKDRRSEIGLSFESRVQSSGRIAVVD